MSKRQITFEYHDPVSNETIEARDADVGSEVQFLADGATYYVRMVGGRLLVRAEGHGVERIRVTPRSQSEIGIDVEAWRPR